MAGILARDVQPRAQMALADSHIGELRNLRIAPDDQGLVISGVVSSFYHKQLAQEAVRAICNGIEIELVNVIRVQERESSCSRGIL